MKLLLARQKNTYLALLASHSCTGGPLLSFFFSVILLTVSTNLKAQDTLQINSLDSNYKQFKTTCLSEKNVVEWETDRNHYLLTKSEIKKRSKTIAAINIGGYGATMIALNAAWYANYPRSSFHTFNDNSEWQQVDKVGHMYSAYLESRMSMEMWRWAGVSRKNRIWIGGLSGVVYQTVIETLDGFSSEWGWSWGDFGANVLGSGILIGQELAWNDQRIKLKFSFHRKDYGDAALNTRANELFGKSLAERSIKDYNAQTYWASVNLKPFLPNSNLPKWLSVAVGYGAGGMFGAEQNIGTDKNGNTTFDRRDIKRYRQWYLAPDIDLSKIKIKQKGVKLLLTVLSSFKFPAPTLEFSNGKFCVHPLYF